MENASKALIIAGAILLSILLISLGIIVYQNAQEAIQGANMDKTAIDSFNSTWTKYVGTNKKLSEVKSLLSAVASNNSVEQNGEGRIITITVGSNTYKTASAVQGVPTSNSWNSSDTYDITATYDDDNTGLITGITIAKHTRGNS